MLHLEVEQLGLNCRHFSKFQSLVGSKHTSNVSDWKQRYNSWTRWKWTLWARMQPFHVYGAFEQCSRPSEVAHTSLLSASAQSCCRWKVEELMSWESHRHIHLCKIHQHWVFLGMRHLDTGLGRRLRVLCSMRHSFSRCHLWLVGWVMPTRLGNLGILYQDWWWIN